MIKPRRGKLLIEIKKQSKFKLRRSGLKHYKNRSSRWNFSEDR